MANTKITNPELFNLGVSTSATQLPVMTTTERTAMSTPSVGETIFNSTTDKVEYWDGAKWYGVTIEVGVVIEYWVIGGGGSAGRDNTNGTAFGGGGGGGILTGTVTISSGETLTATTTGQGGNYQTSANIGGNPGGNTTLTSQTLGTLTADGGGGGGSLGAQAGGNGGSGGGGSGSGLGGTATVGQGFNGGNSAGGYWSAGGGGYLAAGLSINGGAGINLTYAKSNNVLATEMFSYGGGSRQGTYPYTAGTNGDGTASSTGINTTAGVSSEPYRGSGGRWMGGGGNSGSILIKAPIANTYTSTGGIIIATDSNYRYFTLTGTGSTLTIN